ncbi:hypothetical protein EC973_000851 [Apophysomyces ossiformis]|uniref:Protein kinase domain-containing protein n=1 Tax=Apophysomyces ossiformis TaxID=679940 RepID=A0A8H7ESB5_9FUNG|nr:hypothetical protein EC973_000851 [Apophysomyces ossiformis]
MDLSDNSLQEKLYDDPAPIVKDIMSPCRTLAQDWPPPECPKETVTCAKEAVHAQNTPIGHRRQQPSVGLGIVTNLREMQNEKRRSKNEEFFSSVIELPRPPPSLARPSDPPAAYSCSSSSSPSETSLENHPPDILIDSHDLPNRNLDVHSFSEDKIIPLPSPAQANVYTTFLARSPFPSDQAVSSENLASSAPTTIPILIFSPLPPDKTNTFPSLSELPILGDVDEQPQDLLSVPITREFKFPSPSPSNAQNEDLIGKLIWKFEIQKLLGVGAFSKVYLANNIESGQKYAIKMISKERMLNDLRVKTSIEREVEILKYIDHPGIIRLEATMETEQYLCIVLEYVEGGELFDYVQKRHCTTPNPAHSINEYDVKTLFLDIVQIVRWMHERNIVHRDLKLENILLHKDDNGNLRAKLTDFGLARVVDPTSPQLTTRCGSEEYAAPEIVQSQVYDGRQTDTWSLGVVLYALLVGYLPFTYNPSRGEKISHMFHRIVCAEVKWPVSKDPSTPVSDQAKHVVERMLVRHPGKRIDLHDVENLPWFADIRLQKE